MTRSHGRQTAVDKVYAATIKAGVAPGVAWQLLFWAIPGAILQFLGGPKRQIGVLFATGLLIAFPMARWAVLAGILCRLVWEKLRGASSEGDMEVFVAGIIAGDAIFLRLCHHEFQSLNGEHQDLSGGSPSS